MAIEFYQGETARIEQRINTRAGEAIDLSAQDKLTLVLEVDQERQVILSTDPNDYSAQGSDILPLTQPVAGADSNLLVVILSAQLTRRMRAGHLGGWLYLETFPATPPAEPDPLYPDGRQQKLPLSLGTVFPARTDV